jgi:hypothetical protein
MITSIILKFDIGDLHDRMGWAGLPPSISPGRLKAIAIKKEQVYIGIFRYKHIYKYRNLYIYIYIYLYVYTGY